MTFSMTSGMILITGASSGIGEACARIFAKNGHDLLLVARRKERLEKLAKALTNQYGIEVQAHALDVRNHKYVTAFFAKRKKLLDRIEVLINNAGLGKGMDNIQDGSIDEWEAMIDTNVKGLLYVSRALLPAFTRKKRGHVVNIGSVAGHWVYPKGNVYCATKHAVHALSQAMRLDMNGSGVRVTEISPGMVETEFSLVRLGSQKKADDIYKGMTPLSAEDIAEAVYWSVQKPPHVNIQEIVLFPTDQASTTVVARR